MKFTEEQIEEIEDRVNNLIQFSTVVLREYLDYEEDEEARHHVALALDDLGRLAQWVRSLRPTMTRYTRNRVRFGRRHRAD